MKLISARSIAITILLCLGLSALTGCASVKMASKYQDAAAKTFEEPPEDMSGLYIYRNSFAGQAFKRDIFVDGVFLGETANKVYFYKLIQPGNHTISTESEFGTNSLDITTEPGQNYYVRQYMKMGVFIGGSNLEVVSEQEGQREVRQCGLAKTKGVSWK